MAQLAGDDVSRLRAAVYRDGRVSHAEAERLLARLDEPGSPGPGWQALTVEALADLLLHQVEPAGYMSERDADWLMARIGTKDRADAGAVELVIGLLERATSAPPALAAFALRLVAGRVVGDAAAGARHLPGVVDAEDVALLSRVLFAFGGDGSVGITRAEAEVLMEINDRTVEEMNDPTWNELFVKAMTNFALASAGHAVPPRAEALRREALFAHAEIDLPGFFARMVAGALSAKSAAQAPDVPDATPADQGEGNAAWLARRLAEGRLLHDNERVLLGAIKRAAHVVPEPLRPLMVKAA